MPPMHDQRLRGVLKSRSINIAARKSKGERAGSESQGQWRIWCFVANPLEDIHNTQKIRAVALKGKYLGRVALLADPAKNANSH